MCLKRTHISAGILVSLPLIMSCPISLIGLIGSIAPDRLEMGFIEHRTLTHSLLFNVISTGIIWVFHHHIGLVWGVCYLSHLFLDCITIKGIPFFYPFDKKYYGLKLIKTGDSIEMLIQLCLVSLIVSVFIRN